MKGVLVIAALVAVSAAALPNGCPKGLSTTLLPDLKDCAGFWRCAGGASLLQACPEGLHFSARLQRCTLPVFARCQAMAGDAPMHIALKSAILDTLRNLISSKAEPAPLVEDELSAPPEQPTGDLPDEEDTLRRFPDVPQLPDKADEADGDTEEAETSNEAGSEKEEQKSADEELEGELDAKEEMEQEEEVEDGKDDEQDESERSEEIIEEEQDEVDSEEEESEEKVNETSEVRDVAAENDGKNRQDLKRDVIVLKKKAEEEEDENKKKSKDLKSMKKEGKKNKSEEKEKDSESDDESEDEE